MSNELVKVLQDALAVEAFTVVIAGALFIYWRNTETGQWYYARTSGDVIRGGIYTDDAYTVESIDASAFDMSTVTPLVKRPA